MRSDSGAQNIKGIITAGSPCTHGLIAGILQGASAAGYPGNRCPQQLHLEYIQRLSAHVLNPHEHLTFHTEKSRRCCGGNPMLPGTRLRNDFRFSHSFCQQCLPQHIIDLVRTGMIQILPLQIYLCTAQFLAHLPCIIQQRRTVRIFP